MRFLALTLALLSAACVSKSKFEAATDALAECKKQRANEKAQAKEESQGLRGQIEASEGELAELREQKKRQAEELKLFRGFIGKLQKMIDVGEVRVYVRRGRLMVGMASKVLFPSGKHELSKRGQRTLARVAKALSAIPGRRFLVAGHTDNRPIGAKLKEQYSDNLDLSAARALTVTRFLIASGLSPKSVGFAGYGAQDPVKSNRTRSGRRRNRRIELIVEPNIARLPKVPKELSGAAAEEGS